jgi:hypothetical protein
MPEPIHRCHVDFSVPEFAKEGEHSQEEARKKQLIAISAL